MSSLNVFQAAMDMYGPPGITHPLLVEKSAWVDERLREMYYRYALTSSNCDEYEAAGLLKENWAWVDSRLEEMCNPPEEEHFPLCPLPVTWGYYRNGGNMDYIEEDSDSVESYIGYKRKRSESDISDYEVEAERAVKRLRCQSPIPTSKYIFQFSNPFCSLDCERYNYAIVIDLDEEDTVSSLDLESVCESCSPSLSLVHVVTDDEGSEYDYDDYESLRYHSP
jgi:hypothetical protein